MKQLFVAVFVLCGVLVAANSPDIKSHAEQLLKQHKFQAAAEYLEAYQNQPDGLYYLSMVKMMTGDLDEAIDLAEKGLKIAQDKDRFYELLGDIYSVKAQTSNMFSAMMSVSKIKNYWKKAIEFNPENLDAKEKLFMFYVMAPGIAGGDENKAEEFLAEVKQKDPIRAALMSARLNQKRKATSDAENDYRQALSQAPDSADVLYEMARFYMNQKQFEKALPNIKKMMQLKPNKAFAYDLFGDWYLEQGKLDSALVQYDLALKKESYQYRIEFKKAKLLAKMGRKQEAKAIAKKLLNSEMFFAVKKQVEDFLKDL